MPRRWRRRGYPPEHFSSRRFALLRRALEALFNPRGDLLSKASSKPLKPVRERLKDDLEARYEKLLTVLEDALEATKQHPVWCPNCKKRAFVEVTDVKAALQAAEFFTNQGFGRPAQAEGESDRSIVFENKVVLVAAED